MAEGHLAEAGAQYEAALRINPQLSVTHNNLGVLLFKLGDAFGVVREYQLAIAGRPGYDEAHYNLAVHSQVAEAWRNRKRPSKVQFAKPPITLKRI